MYAPYVCNLNCKNYFKGYFNVDATIKFKPRISTIIFSNDKLYYYINIIASGEPPWQQFDR